MGLSSVNILSFLDICFSDNTTEQKEDSDTEEDTELSKNAQFRAIQPSPSIISFVEENVICLG